MRRGTDRRFDAQELEQALGRAGGTLQIADDFAQRTHSARHDDRIEDECRKLPFGQATGQDVVPADPENDSHGAENQDNDRRDQQCALADPAYSRTKRGLDSLRKHLSVRILVAVGLHHTDLVQRFVEECADVADTVLRRAREAAHPPPEQDDRDHDDRHARKNEKRELGTRQRQHDEAAGHQQQVADGDRRARADQRLEHRRIVDQARYDLSRTRGIEKGWRQVDEMIEYRSPQIGGDALTEPRHVEEPHVGRDRHDDDDDEHQPEHAIELADIGGGEAAIDDELDSLSDREHGRRRDDEPDERQDDLAADTGCRNRPARATVFSAIPGGIRGAGSRRVSARAMGSNSKWATIGGGDGRCPRQPMPRAVQ